MSSLVSLANDIFASDLNELQQFRDQLEIRQDALNKKQEREDFILKQKQLEEDRLEKERQEAEAAHASSSASHGARGGANRSTRGGTTTKKEEQQAAAASARSRRSGGTTAGTGGGRPGSAHSRGSLDKQTNEEDGDEANKIPPPVLMPRTDLSGIVEDSRLDPFLAAVQELDHHAQSVTDANFPYQQWMKKRMSYLNSRSKLIGDAPIPEDVLGDDETDAEVAGSQVQPPPLAIPLLAFTRAHTDELKSKYSYSPPRGLLNAGKVTEEEKQQMNENIQDDNLKNRLQIHTAGETWKDGDALSGTQSGNQQQQSSSYQKKNVTLDHDDEDESIGSPTKRSRKIKRKPSMFSSSSSVGKTPRVSSSSNDNDQQQGYSTSDSETDQLTTSQSVNENLNYSENGSQVGSSSGGGGKGGAVGKRGAATTQGGSISDFTEMYLPESDGAINRRAARQREQDKFHSKMRSSVEFSSKKLIFKDCLPSTNYTQTFKLWNRSNDLRRFKVVPGSSEALQKSRVSGQSFEATWGKKKDENNESSKSEENQQQENKNVTISSSSKSENENNNTNNTNESSFYELDGNEAYDIPKMTCRVISPSDFSPDSPIAPGTSIVVEVTVTPHWSAFETADCNIAVIHVRDVNSHVRGRNDMSQWHCEELPCVVQMCQPKLNFRGNGIRNGSSAVVAENNNNVQGNNNNPEDASASLSSLLVAATQSVMTSSLQLPTCFVGNSVSETFTVTNEGSHAVFSLRLMPLVNSFKISPSFLDLQKNESTEITICYTPREDQLDPTSGSHLDTAEINFEGSLVPSTEDHDNNDLAARRKGRRRVLKQQLSVSALGTDACVYISTIGNSCANQVAMKQHRGADAVGNVNINDAVIGFAAWRPIVVTNDSELDIPVTFVSGCIPSSSCFDNNATINNKNKSNDENETTDHHASLTIKQTSIIVPAKSTSTTVQLYLSTHKGLTENPAFVANKETIQGRFFMLISSNSNVPELAVQRAHQRRFASLLPKIPSRKPREQVDILAGAAAVASLQHHQQSNNKSNINKKRDSSSVDLASAISAKSLLLSLNDNNKNNKKNNNNNEAIFVEEFDVTSKPSKPALSFTPFNLDMTDVDALTNQTNVCDAILRNDGAGELTFYFVSTSKRKNLQSAGFSPRRLARKATAAVTASSFIQQEEEDDHNSSDDSDNDTNNNNKSSSKSKKQHQRQQQEATTTTFQQREKLLAASSQTGAQLLSQCGIDSGHDYDEDGGIEWWTVPAFGTIAPGVELRISIRYCMRRAGNTTASLEAFSPLLDNRSPLLTLLARGRGPNIQANCTSLEFGSVTFGGESEARFNLFNPTENAVYVSVSDGHVNDSNVVGMRNEIEVVGEEENETTAGSLTSFSDAKNRRLVIAPTQCTLHPRQTAIITVYLRAVNPGKNEDYVKVKVEDGTDLLIPFSGTVVVPELIASPSTLRLGSVDRDVVIPCTLTLSNPSCIPIDFEVCELEPLEGICSVDLIGLSNLIPAGALDVPVNFTVTFDSVKDQRTTCAFAFASPQLQHPVIVQLRADSICQPTVALAVTLPGKPLFCQSTEGFIGALLRNVVEDALEYSSSSAQAADDEQEQQEIYDDDEQQQQNIHHYHSHQHQQRVVAPFIDPIVLTGTIDSTLPYCAQDFEILIKNPTGCVFPCSSFSCRFPASKQVIMQALENTPNEMEQQHLAPFYLQNQNTTAVGASSPGKHNMLTPVPPTQTQTAVSASAAGRSTRLPKINTNAIVSIQDNNNNKNVNYKNTTNKPTTSARSNISQKSAGMSSTKSLGKEAVPPLESHAIGKTFFCRQEDGTDARDRAREELLAAAAALVQTGREVAVDIASKDDRDVSCTLDGFDTHPLSVRCLATIPGVFQDKVRLDFGTGVPSTELPVTFRVSGQPIVVDPSTSAMTLDPVSGQATLQLPSVVAGMKAVKRTIQITSRCPRDIKVDCKITVTGSSVGSTLLPSDIFGGEAAVSTSLFSKEGDSSSSSASAACSGQMEKNWATVSPSTFTLNALQSSQVTIEYHPPNDTKVPSWDGVLHMKSTIVQTSFNDKFLISEFYEQNSKEKYPNVERVLNPVVVGGGISSSSSKNTASAAATSSSSGGGQIRVKGVSKLPLRVPLIKRFGVVENGILIHRAAAQIEASKLKKLDAIIGLESQKKTNNNKQKNSQQNKKEFSMYPDETDSSDDDNNSDTNEFKQQQQKEEKDDASSSSPIKKAEERRDLLARVKRDRPSSAAGASTTTSQGGGGFDAAAHQANIQETVLILEHLRRRYSELQQFTTGGFVLPTELNLHVRHIHPVLDIDPFPLVRFPKCFVPSLPPTIISASSYPPSSPAGYVDSAIISGTILSAAALQTATQIKKITPLPNNLANIRLQNNGITTIEARLFLEEISAQFFKVVGFYRRHSDSRPKRAAAKYEPSPIEGTAANISEQGDWTSSPFKMNPLEILDISVALVNAQGSQQLSSLLEKYSAENYIGPRLEDGGAAPFAQIPGLLELRFSNGESQKINLSSHVYVPRVHLVEDFVEFRPTLEVALGRGETTLTHRITLVNSSPCAAAFEIVPIMKVLKPTQLNKNKRRSSNVVVLASDDDGEEQEENVQFLKQTAGLNEARQRVAKSAAKALTDTNKKKSSTSKNTRTNSPVRRRNITLKAAANAVDLNTTSDASDKDSDADLSSSETDQQQQGGGCVYDTGRFSFSSSSGHLPPSSSGGVGSRCEIDVTFEPFASTLFEAKFEIRVEGGVGSVLSVVAQSRVTEV